MTSFEWTAKRWKSAWWGVITSVENWKGITLISIWR